MSKSEVYMSVSRTTNGKDTLTAAEVKETKNSATNQVSENATQKPNVMQNVTLGFAATPKFKYPTIRMMLEQAYKKGEISANDFGTLTRTGFASHLYDHSSSFLSSCADTDLLTLSRGELVCLMSNLGNDTVDALKKYPDLSKKIVDVIGEAWWEKVKAGEQNDKSEHVQYSPNLGKA